MELNKPSEEKRGPILIDIRRITPPSEEKSRRSRRYRPYARKSPPDLDEIKYQIENPHKFITTVNLKDLPDIVPPDVRIAELGFDERVFDVNRRPCPRYSGEAVAIRNFKKDPSRFTSLTKSASLAIRDYNKQTHSDYQFLDIEMVTYQIANGILYNITFQARNAANGYGTFQATVLRKKEFRKVKRIRIKESSTWYDGTLMQLEDDAPIIMDPKDHYRGAYDLMEVAQQLRKPDMGFVMAKQDEGAESARALPVQ